jgi:hypothetical protein
MAFIVILKFFHFLSLFLAGGAGVANVLIGKEHQKAKEAPSAVVQRSMMKLARIGLVAMVLLWVTGIGLLGATVLLAVIVFMNYYLPAMAKKAQAPDPMIMKVVPMVGRASMVLALLGIAITTTA